VIRVVSLSIVNNVNMRVYPFPPPAVWIRVLPLSTVNSVDVRMDVFLSTINRVDMEVFSCPPPAVGLVDVLLFAGRRVRILESSDL
jgi:hypothetical protein